MPQNRLLRKFIGRKFLFANAFVWNHLPVSSTAAGLIRSYGTFLHSIVLRVSDRNQYHGTFFLRNRPELQLFLRLVDRKEIGSELKIAVIGCSNGAEAYSILWTVRSARPDLKVTLNAADVSGDILAIAKEGRFSLKENDMMMDAAIFERLTELEMQEMFDMEGECVSIKPWIREGINFQVADAGDSQIVEAMGRHHIVVANRFLCHMDPPEAERCLRNLARLVEPGGYLFVSGIDLDVRTKVAISRGWTPVQDLIKEIHDGDSSIRRDWPMKWWGLEPFTTRRRDWKARYASVFQLGKPCDANGHPPVKSQ